MAATESVFPEELRARYRPQRVLGAGGFGVVHLAEDTQLSRPVAVKLLKVDDATLRARTLREAKVLAELRHPHIVDVYDVGETDSGPYLVMEYVEGRPLSPELPPDQALARMLEVAEALGRVHELGLVHRDMKPENVLLATDGRAVLLDLGIVRDERGTQLTGEGAIMGTLPYMAPEVFTTGEVSPAADWWAWGVTLYELREGRTPWDADRVLAAAGRPGWPPLSFASLGPGDPARRLVSACLDADPSRRPDGPAALRALLDARDEDPLEKTRLEATRELAAPEPPPPARPRWPIAAGLGMLLLGLWLSGSPAGETPAASPTASTPPTFVDGVRAALPRLQEIYRADPDPLTWPVRVRAVPAVDDAFRWLAAGPSTEELTRIEDDLADLDETFRDAELYPLFGALREEIPAQVSLAESGTRIQHHAPPSLFPPDTVFRGWTAAAVYVWRKAFRRFDHLHEELRGDPNLLPEGARTLLLDRGERLPKVSTRFHKNAHRRENRIDLARWARRFRELYRTFLRLAARAVREEGEEPGRDTVLLWNGISDFNLLHHLDAGGYPPEVLLEGPVDTLGLILLEAEILRSRRVCWSKHTDLEAEWTRIARLEAARWDRLAAVEATTLPRRAIRRQGLTRGLQLARDRGDWQPAIRELRRCLTPGSERDETTRIMVIYEVGRTFSKNPESLAGVTPEELSRVIETVDENRDHIPDFLHDQVDKMLPVLREAVRPEVGRRIR